MAVKDLYVPYEDFKELVHQTESGLMREMIRRFTTQLEQRCRIGDDDLHRLDDITSCYLMYYPFTSPFDPERCWSTSSRYVKEREWLEDHKGALDTYTELPIFVEGNRFANYYERRLKYFISSAMNQEELAAVEDYPVLLNQGRNCALVLKNTEHLIEDLQVSKYGYLYFRDRHESVIQTINGSYLRPNSAEDLSDCPVYFLSWMQLAEPKIPNPDRYMTAVHFKGEIEQRLEDQLRMGCTTLYPYQWLEY